MTKSPWRFFPVAVLAALAAVIAVNASMITFAYRSHPGSAGIDGYDLGKVYDRVLAEASRQAALGWEADLQVDEARHPVLHVTDRNGMLLDVVATQAMATRPVGPPHDEVLTFTTENSLLRATQTLGRGQWNVQITMTHNGESLTETKRLIVP